MHMKRITDEGGTLTPFMATWPDLGEDVLIFSGAQVIGRVSIGAQSSVWHNCVLRGDVNTIRVGTRSNIQDGTVIHVSTNTFPTTIGNDVLIAHMAMLHGCTLKDRCFVGIGAIVMDNCTIEEDGMLAAGGMLTPGKVIGKGELWAGRPAKFMRMLTDKELHKNRSMAGHYYNLACQHRRDLAGDVTATPYPPPDMNIRN